MDNQNETVVVIKKKSVFQKIKDKWNQLDEDEKTWLKVVAIWFVDGGLIGAIIANGVNEKRSAQAIKVAHAQGYIQGTMDTCKEFARNPYQMIDAGMQKLEQQGKAKRF